MSTLIFAAALAGLVGTPHCLAMCGGFAAASARNGGSLAWSFGRLTTYGMAGAVVGGLGAMLPGPTWLPGAVAGLLLIWFALGVAGLLGPTRVHSPWIVGVATALAGRNHPTRRFAFGMATALLPCGLVYAALAMAVASGSAASGAVTMIAFGAATLPGLSLLSSWAQRLALTSMWRRRAFAMLLVLAGGVSIALRAGGAHAHDVGANAGPAHGAGVHRAHDVTAESGNR